MPATTFQDSRTHVNDLSSMSNSSSSSTSTASTPSSASPSTLSEAHVVSRTNSFEQQQIDAPKAPSRKRRHTAAPRSGPPSLQPSSALPLPKGHIRRTPSELQLADDMARAEYEDVRMFSRLVVGMQHQVIRDHAAGRGVNPLSKKSLAGVVKTKHAKEDDLLCDGGDETEGEEWAMDGIPESDESELSPSGEKSTEGDNNGYDCIDDGAADDDRGVFSLDL